MSNKISLIKKGSDVELQIESLAFGGMGVAHLNNIVTFVKNAIPGQKVKARITKKSTSFLEARCLSVIDQSPYYIKEKCIHFSDCGGCTFQNFDYNLQTDSKEKQVIEIFNRLGKFAGVQCDSIIKCENIYNYRNKMEFTYSNQEYLPERVKDQKPADFALGLHAPKRWDKVLNINNCDIQSMIANKILIDIKKLTLDLTPYDIRKHTGFMRNVIIRVGQNTGEIMINFVTNYFDKEKLNPIVQNLIKKYSSIVSIINNITKRRSSVSYAETQFVLYGNDHIIEKLGDYEFIISADSFFQTNTMQAKVLYDIILEESNLSGGEVVYDLFSGTGSISLYISKYAKMVYGFELVMSSIQDAIQNAIHNDIKNVWFFAGDLENIFHQNMETKTLERPDLIIVDPPRAGMHKKTIDDIIDKSPKRIVYVSCNPATQARDINYICTRNYKLKKLRPIDMFPHTPHIENVATMIRVS